MSRLPWYVTRASGLTAWALVLISIVWGLAMALPRFGFTRRAGPAWTLALHRWLGALALAFIAVHVVSLLIDDFVHFSLAAVLVPLVSGWHPVAVAWGIVAMYLLVAVEVTSLARRRLPPKVWRQLHLLAYAAFGLSTVHMVTAGTDTTALVGEVGAIALATLVMFGVTLVWAWRTEPASRRAASTLEPSLPR
jgi:DMSO/TMAO reductase YedYZ heme-binding membrane subunit